jgi:hypothetical protein
MTKVALHLNQANSALRVGQTKLGRQDVIAFRPNVIPARGCTAILRR